MQVILRGLEQKTGDSTVWSPSVTTMPGQRARLEEVRDFTYPTEYDPPEVPDSVSGNDSVPITPATPTAFETRPVGTIFDVEPIVDATRTTIRLDLKPEFSEFVGFVNSGSPILMLGENALGLPVTIESTPNDILQPIFEQTKLETSVTINDGATIAVGGLTRMEISQVNDRVPVLSSLPFVGNYFKSNGTKTIRRAVVIFVTVELVDPTGKKWRDIRNF